MANSAFQKSSIATPVSVANGGTGITSAGANGNILTSNGSVWASTAPAASGGDYIQLADVTLSGNATTLASGTITAKRFLRIQVLVQGRSTAVQVALQFNADTGSNYDYRISTNSGSIGNQTGQTSLWIAEANAATPFLATVDIFNLTTSLRKGVMGKSVDIDSGGNNMYDFVGTWLNTANQITSVTLLANGSATLTAGTRMIIYGSKDA